MLFADFPNSKFWFPEFVSSYAWHVTHGLLISVNDRVISPFRETSHMRSSAKKNLAEISEFTIAKESLKQLSLILIYL